MSEPLPVGIDESWRQTTYFYVNVSHKVLAHVLNYRKTYTGIAHQQSQ
jgi:hypothetical protein